MNSYKNLSQIYDELIYEDIDYDKMCSKIMDLSYNFNINKNNYLDLACGTGTLASKVGKNFKNSFLIDESEDMLVEAYDKLKENKIKGNIICQDMRNLDINRKFDLITCSLDSTNYIIEDEDLISYFKGVKNILEDTGIFIFDINSYYKLSEILGNNIYTYDEEKIFYCWENSFEDDILYMNLTFFVKDHGESYKKFQEEHIERAYKTEYIEGILDQCGLRILRKMDNYCHDEIKNNTERITYVVTVK